MNKNKILKKLKIYSEITIGVIILDAAFFYFFTPTNLVNGGGMGISLILNRVFNIPTSLFMYIFNIITLIIGLFLLGKDFFFKTVYASILSPTLLLIFELFGDPNFFMKNVVEGKLIIACLCGSIIMAFGLGLCFRNNGSTGGMDVIQKIMSKYLHMPLSKTMFFTDWIIVFLGGFSFIGGFAYNIEALVYGVIAVLLTGYLVDNIALNSKARRTAYIITDKYEEIKEFIFNKIERGVTIVDCKGAYTNEDKKMLICTLDKNESYILADFLREIDSNAFTFMSSTREVVGYYEGVNRR